MTQKIKSIAIFAFLILISLSSRADPWFTGPLLAPAGHTIPNGHSNFEIYALDIFTDGKYDNSGQLVRTPLFRSFVINPLLTHGFTDWLDVQIALPYTFNSSQGFRVNRLADVSGALGIQLIEQKGSPNRADVRILLQEVIPTGKYDGLNPSSAGTDASGLGTYQTQIGLNFQYLLPVFTTHYLRTRLIIDRIYSSPVTINGLSIYGGSVDTHGTIKPGTEDDIDLAFEYTLTQNWVAVMEGYIAKGQTARFNGILNVGTIGGVNGVLDLGSFEETALAPAIEYNFNEHIGIIGGVWYPVHGVNTSHYMTYVLALNAFW